MKRRDGMSLIELVLAMALLSVLLLVVAATLWGAVRIEKLDAATFDQMIQQSRLADQFRHDVAEAVEVPERFGELAAGPTCLILKRTDSRHVIYRWQGDELRRSEHSGDERSMQATPAGGERVSVEFERAESGGRLVTLRLTESRGVGQTRHDHAIEIRAALGGDTR